MIVSGVLLVGDAAVTLLWQEPISAYVADRQQTSLGRQLEDPPERVLRKRPLRGDAIGRISLPAIERTYYVVEGTDGASLRKGPGHYPDTPLPGDRGTVAIAGHRTTYGAPFRSIDKLGRRDRIVIEMPYGTFHYRVENTRIVPADALWITDPVGYDRLVLSACHPLYSAAERVAVFARLASRGPPRVRKD
jgi:sortase A